MSNRKNSRTTSRSWDAVAEWYAGWVGPKGSQHHRAVAIPTLLELLAPRAGEHILDVGCGTGVLAPYVDRADAHYTGIDSSGRMIRLAQRTHGSRGRFIRADAAVQRMPAQLSAGTFDAAAYLLSIQDIDPLGDTLALSASLLRRGGRLIIVMTHPCFRVPRQSGWGWDPGRRLRFRRVDHYLTPLAVPMKQHPRGHGATRSYHRPLEAYVDALADAGLLVERVREVPFQGLARGGRPAAEQRADREFPLFLGILAVKPELSRRGGSGGRPG